LDPGNWGILSGRIWQLFTIRKDSKMDRPAHWLDESLNLCLDQSVADLPTPTARLLLNLAGAVRSLERQSNATAEEVRYLRDRLARMEAQQTRPDVDDLIASLPDRPRPVLVQS
jgi:hypothetical protein